MIERDLPITRDPPLSLGPNPRSYGLARKVGLRRLQLPTSLTSRRCRYSYGFDLCLSPIRHSKRRLSKWLSTEGHAPEGSQQSLNRPGKDVGNCKAQRTLTVYRVVCWMLLWT